METLRIQSPKASARSILSPLISRSPSAAGGRWKASPLASRSGRENANPNEQIAPPTSPSLPFSPKASTRKANGLLREQLSAPVDESMSGADRSLEHSEPSVKVVVRVKPGNGQNPANEGVVRKISSDSLSVGDRAFNFHAVLGPESTQEDLFKTVGIPLVNYSLEGFNTSILSYGQTGSGKTYTIWGPAGAMVNSDSVDSEQGIAPRIFKMLFSEINKRQEGLEEKQINYQCRCSFLEIYNDQINDLLDPTQRNLQIREDTKNGSHVENLTDEYFTTVDDVTQLLVKGLANRKVGATSMNCKSSRSHVVFTCIVESWSKVKFVLLRELWVIVVMPFSPPWFLYLQLSASKCFSSSKTSKIILADLAGSDDGIIDAVGKKCVREQRHIKKSLSKLGKIVNIIGETKCSAGDKKIPYTDSCLTHLLQETLGGNAKVAVICAISPYESSRIGTLSTLRFGERAKQMQNKAVINEISEDDVNGLSDQIRQLKEELMRAKLDVTTDGRFKGRIGRQSLNHLRVSLNRSLLLPRIDLDSDEEMDVDEEDVSNLCVQLDNLNSSLEDKSKDSLERQEIVSIAHAEGPNADQDSQMDSAMDSDNKVNIGSLNGQIRLQKTNSEISEIVEGAECASTPKNENSCKDSVRKAGLSITCGQGPVLQDPIMCSSPKLGNALNKSFIASESPRPNLHLESVKKLPELIRSSLQSSKPSPTDSLAASLHRGLQIIDYHERNPSARNSFIGLSFEHLTTILTKTKDVGGITPLLCSSCKNVIDDGSEEVHNKSDMQIVPVGEDINGPSKREKELEALCAEQAATIKHLSCIVDQQKQDEENCMKLSKNHQLNDDERETQLLEIQSLKEQLMTAKHASEDDCLLDQIRTGGAFSSGIAGEDYEKEKQKWTESESRWISLTEEMRVDLDKNRRLAEKKEVELEMEKNCTAELNDALQRSILGHARIVEHYAELQENYAELLLKHRKIMEGIAEVKKAAMKAGRKGRGSAFAAALSAELSTLRIDREKERTYLKEQNRKLRIQLRDTAEAVHAAGELLVRLREAEEASSVSEEKYRRVQQEVEKMKKQMEKQKRKHAMELVTMKHFLAGSRLPESALEPLYQHESEIIEESKDTAAPDDDQSWRAAFRPSYQ
ncbi:hypothetical protein Cni_G11279 [Canna indica]|uniref:Kinesin motor domain-containing protein n=1 Tax=Canna indica TaxID=4628 RepID=A0AAQ3K601_9LILI|nr:hypothetical protein Cni_G11279 [Canna indica]